MNNDKMCLWVDQRVCVHPAVFGLISSTKDIIDSKTLKEDFCQYCLKGQEIMILTKISKRKDNVVTPTLKRMR
jgi:hypothetical protein